MAIQDLLLILVGMILLAVLIEPLARRIHLPFTALLVAVGFLASEALVAMGTDTGLRAEGFRELVFYVFLPILVFESAYHIDADLLLRNLVAILLLAIPLMLLSTLTSGSLVYLGIAHPSGFPWIAGLLCGALLAATDPVAVVALYRQLGAPERLAVLLEGESLFNDAAAIVLFSLFLELALASQPDFDPVATSLHFLWVFSGGAVVGLVVALLGLGLARRFREPVTTALITLICAYGAYLISEQTLHVSGVTAVLTCGLLLGHGRIGLQQNDFISLLWEFLAYLCNALVFLLMGATITLAMFEERWLAILIGIGAVLAARALGLLGLVPAYSGVARWVGAEPIPTRYLPLLFWGGLRGAVTLALALSLPTDLEYWWTIQAVAFGVVVFTLFVQAPTTPWLLRCLGLLQPKRVPVNVPAHRPKESCAVEAGNAPAGDLPAPSPPAPSPTARH